MPAACPFALLAVAYGDGKEGKGAARGRTRIPPLKRGPVTQQVVGHPTDNARLPRAKGLTRNTYQTGRPAPEHFSRRARQLISARSMEYRRGCRIIFSEDVPQ